jgi:hypothetical protein
MLYSFSGNCGHVDGTSEKGTRVYDPDKPAPTITSHMNHLFLCGDGAGGHSVTYSDLNSALEMKSFSAAESSFIRALSLSRAFKVVANAIPRRLLRAVYERALFILDFVHGSGNRQHPRHGLSSEPAQECTMAVGHQFVSDEVVEAERARILPFLTHSSVGGAYSSLPKTLREHSKTRCGTTSTCT